MAATLPKSGDQLPKEPAAQLPKDPAGRLPVGVDTENRLPRAGNKLPDSGDVSPSVLSKHSLFTHSIKSRSLPNGNGGAKSLLASSSSSLLPNASHSKLPNSQYTLPGFSKIIPEEIEPDEPESKEEADIRVQAAEVKAEKKEAEEEEEAISRNAEQIALEIQDDIEKLVDSKHIVLRTPAKANQKRDAMGRFVAAYKTSPLEKRVDLKVQLQQDIYAIDTQNSFERTLHNLPRLE